MKKLLLALLPLLFAVQASAGTYWVSKSGKDGQCTNSGSPQTSGAELTIAGGLACLTGGSTLNVRTGTYTEKIENGVPAGSSGAYTNIVAYDGTLTVTLQPASGGGVIYLYDPAISYINFDGFVMNAVNTAEGVDLECGVHHIRVQNSEIKNAQEDGFQIAWGCGDATSSDSNEFLNNLIHDNGLTGGQNHGLYIKTSNNTIRGNQVYNNAGYGIHVYNPAKFAGGNIVEQNVVHDNNRVVPNGNNAYGILIGSGTDNRAFNNIIYHDNGGIKVGYGSTVANLIYNNTVYDNVGYGLDMISGTATARNNIFYNNAAGTVLVESGTLTQGDNLTTDPSFENPAAANFALTSKSTDAVDHGADLSAYFTNDIVGTPRPQGSSWDIGAYEYISTGPVYYVAATGGDNGRSCQTATNPSTPKASITNAIQNCLTPGDTISIKAGTYVESLDNIFPTNCTANSRCTIQTYSTDVVTIRPNAGNDFVIEAGQNESYLTFRSGVTGSRNLILDATNVTYDAVRLMNKGYIIEDTEIFGAPEQGIALSAYYGQGYGDDSRFSRNYIHDGGISDFDHAFYVGGSNNIIEDNLLVNWQSPLQLFSGYGNSVSNNIVRGNIVRDSSTQWHYDNAYCQNYGASAPCGGRTHGIIIYRGDNIQVYNNIIARMSGVDPSGSAGLVIGGSVSNSLFANNTLVDIDASGSPGLHVESTVGTGVIVKNNLIINTLNGGAAEQYDATVDHTNNVITGTKANTFVDADNNDFRLKATSSAKDAGISTPMSSYFNVDIVNTTRGFGAGWDVGAYEYTGGATYWVSKSGNDSNDCNDSPSPLTTTAKLTIEGGLTCVGHGDTLNIRSGTYDERVIITGSQSNGTSASAVTTIQGYSTENPTIKTPGGEPINEATAQPLAYISFKNFILDGTNSYDETGWNLDYGAHDITIDGLEITGFHYNGILLAASTYNILITHSSIHDQHSITGVEGTRWYGIYLHGANATIEYNDIYNNPGGGIQAYSTNRADVHDNTIKFNKVHANNNLASSFVGGILDAGVSGGKVYGNLVYNNGVAPAGEAYGIKVYNGTDGSMIYNNTIYGNQNAGIVIDAVATNTIVWNNIVYNNGSQITDGGSNTNFLKNLCDTAGTGCGLTGDPAFVNGAGGNFALTSKSPAIDQGENLSSYFTTDIVNTTRGLGAGWDIGAYEFVTTPSAPTIAISTPTSQPTYVTSQSSITVSGNASDDVAVTSVGWSCPTCTPTSGVASGTDFWSIASLGLAMGQNVITVTAYDADKNATSDTITITRSAAGGQLVLALSFDAGIGNTATDSSGQNNSGSLSGSGVSWDDSGKYGKALSFNGSTGYVTVQDANSLDLTLGMTLEAWVYPTTNYDNTFRMAVTKSGSGYFLFTDTEDYVGCSRWAGGGFYHPEDNPSYYIACDSSVLPTNQWSYLTTTYDGNTLRQYRNGSLISSVNTTAGIHVDTGVLYVGRSEYGEYFAGKIDEVRVWNYARSGSDIVTDMNTAIGQGITNPPTSIKLSSSTANKFGSNGSAKVGHIP